MEPLAIALVLSAGMCVRFYWRARSAEKLTSYWQGLYYSKVRELNAIEEARRAALKDRDQTHAKWLDMKRRYLDSLDEIAELRERGGGNAA